MKAFGQILDAARQARCRIVLAEGEEPRVAEAAVWAKRERIADVVLIGKKDSVRQQLKACGGATASFEVEGLGEPAVIAKYVDAYRRLRGKDRVSEEAARAAVGSAVGLAAMMVRSGDADAMVAGAANTTADTIRMALQVIGRGPNARLVSSFFLMVLCQARHSRRGAVVFADCGLVVDPDADELAEIAIASADSFADLLGEEPRVAMLSYSTKGSARYPSVDKVVKATRIVQQRRLDIQIDGELQFDAAFVPDVSARKSPSSCLRGEANVLIFPTLEAGNIGYKIAERIGGAIAVGPVLQGLLKPANDLSRGCSARDICHMIALTAVQASGKSKQSEGNQAPMRDGAAAAPH